MLVLLVLWASSIVQCSKDTIDLRGNLWRKRPRLLSLQILIVAGYSIHQSQIAGRQPRRNALLNYFVRPFQFHPFEGYSANSYQFSTVNPKRVRTIQAIYLLFRRPIVGTIRP